MGCVRNMMELNEDSSSWMAKNLNSSSGIKRIFIANWIEPKMHQTHLTFVPLLYYYKT